eukprot:gb/GECG01015611.1/.p1 GENE.gb/GECG01015611.1/~~gb/GECG01015611.1/.p1  ORF type:complete len:539 (+),score=44.88 gb/GECG01015611.1/:1-1617(+)
MWEPSPPGSQHQPLEQRRDSGSKEADDAALSEGLQRLQALLAEFVGTFFLSLTVTMVQLESHPVNPFIGPGLALSALVYALDHKSGAHFNPAVTVGVVVCSFSTTSVIQGIMYILVQTLGGVCGSLAGVAIADAAPSVAFVDFDVAHPQGAAFLVEFFYAFALVLVMLNTATEKNSAEPNAYFGMSIGFVILAGGNTAGQISGGVFNAAVGTGLDVARIMHGNTSHYLWIYWVATLVAGLLAGVVKAYVNNTSHFSGNNASIFGLPVVVLIIEFIGTFFLTFTAAFEWADPLSIGAIILSMVYMGDHLCGVDFNPAVTLGAALRWAVPIGGYWRIFLTAVAQFAGSFAAAFLVYAIAGESSRPSLSGNVYDTTGHVAFEALWSTILVYTVCSVMTSISEDPKDDRQLQRRGIAIGFIVAAGLYSGGQNGIPVSSVFNPAIGTALSSVDAAFQHAHAHRLWVYWLGPFLGSFFGSGLFSLLHAHNDPVSEEENLSDLGHQGYMEQTFNDLNLQNDTSGYAPYGHAGLSDLDNVENRMSA